MEMDSISIASKRARMGFCEKFCERFFGVRSGFYVLKWWEFMSILIFLNTSMTFNAYCIKLSLKWGSTMVLVTFVTAQILIASPLCMAYMFLGYYSRRSYIRLWDCVPLIKGLGYSVLLSGMVVEVFNVAYSGLTLLYAFWLIAAGNIPWANCDFPNAHPECLPMSVKADAGTFRYNKTCCSMKECGFAQKAKDSAKFSTLDFYMSYVLQRGYEDEPLKEGLHYDWVIVVVILWVALCFCMIIGLRRFRKVFCVINITMFIAMIPAIIMVVYSSSNYSMMKEMETDYKNLFNGEMWFDLAVHFLYREIPSDIVAISALSVPVISTTTDTSIIYAFKVFWGAIGIVWSCIAAKHIQTSYQIRDSLCIMFRGDYLLYVMLPEYFAQAPLGHLTITLSFLITFFWNFTVSAFILTNGIEALLDEFKVLVRFRWLLAVLAASAICALNVQILNARFMEYFDTYVGNTYATIIGCQLITAWIGLFIYSVTKISDDYHFMFATKFDYYWIFGLKLGSVTCCGLVVLVYMHSAISRDGTFFCIATLSPIPAGMVIMGVRFYMRINQNLLDSHPLWGPPQKQRRIARAVFDPVYNMRYGSKAQKCTHNCLLRSAATNVEMTYWQTKMDLMTMVFKEEEPLQQLLDESREVSTDSLISKVN